MEVAAEQESDDGDDGLMKRGAKAVGRRYQKCVVNGVPASLPAPPTPPPPSPSSPHPSHSFLPSRLTVRRYVDKSGGRKRNAVTIQGGSQIRLVGRLYKRATGKATRILGTARVRRKWHVRVVYLTSTHIAWHDEWEEKVVAWKEKRRNGKDGVGDDALGGDASVAAKKKERLVFKKHRILALGELEKVEGLYVAADAGKHRSPSRLTVPWRYDSSGWGGQVCVCFAWLCRPLPSHFCLCAHLPFLLLFHLHTPPSTAALRICAAHVQRPCDSSLRDDRGGVSQVD